MGQAPIRFWGDELPPNADALVKEKWAQVRANRPELLRKGKRPVVNFLALSGGGSDGAFGAGLLGGWTASGNRPEFDLVTGVSTGALTAPFAFLGPRYDDGSQEGFHRVDHQGRCHRPADQRPARRRFACEQCAAGQDRRLLRECSVPPGGGGRASQGPPASDRHHQSRRRAPGDLGHGPDRHQRPPGSARSFPQGAARLGGNPGRVPTRLRQGGGRWSGL